MHWLTWKLFKTHWAIVFNKNGFSRISKIHYPHASPIALEPIWKDVTLETKLNPDGSTSSGGNWVALYPSSYKHPMKDNYNG